MTGTTTDSPPSEPQVSVQFLGQFLVSQGHVNREELEAALDFQEENNLPLGALALSKGLLSERQLLIVHAQQMNTEDRFGEVAVRRGFLTRHQLDELLREQKEARVLIGDALVRAGAVDADTLAVAVQQYRVVQERAQEQVEAEMRLLPDAHLISPAIQLTTRLLLRMCGLVAKVAAVSQDTRLAHFDYALWQEVEGTRPFTYALHVDGIDLLDLSEAVLFALDDETALPDEVDPLVLDVGKEFVNILVGHLCTWLDREGHRTTPLPPGSGEGNLDPPSCWEGPVRRINVRLVMPRTAMAVSILVRPGDESS